MVHKPHFNSAALNAAVTSNESCFKEYKANLDRMNSDIKSLEEYIRAAGVGIRFDQFMCGLDFSPLETETLLIPKGSQNAAFLESLIWDRYEDGAYRLIYRLEGPLEDFTQEREVLEFKPLLEVKVTSRKRMHDLLPRFVKGLAAMLSGNSEDFFEAESDPEPTFEDEIPF